MFSKHEFPCGHQLNTNVHRLFTTSTAARVRILSWLPAGAYADGVADDQTTARAFRLSDLATATPITPGTPMSDTLTRGLAQSSTNSMLAAQPYYFAVSRGLPNSWRLINPCNELFKQVSRRPFAAGLIVPLQ